MAQVLSQYPSSTLRCSPPDSPLVLTHSPSLKSSPSLPLVDHLASLPSTTDSSLPSTADSSPPPSTVDFSKTMTSTCTPSRTTLSLPDSDDISFPDYDGVRYYTQGNAYAEESSDELMESTTTDTTRSDSPLPTPVGVDDSAVRQEPSRHVDYLSHNWREEDIWSSWRHIVSQRRVYGQRSRLENASWRTWAKSKYRLTTVSPETLNWLKESDVTWLYGPLKIAQSHPITHRDSAPESMLSKNNSFVNKKPILKKRSMSEVMLQKSISTTSLLKQATASIQAQQSSPAPRREMDTTRADFVFSPTSSEAPSRGEMDYFTRHSASTGGSPIERAEERHIRFDNTVEQCIAVECKDGEFDDEPGEDSVLESTDSDSDEGLVMMRRRKRPGLSRRNTGSTKSSRSNSQGDRKTIETLPSTTLKYRTDSPDMPGEAQSQSQTHRFNRSKLSPSPSQETLRPTNPSKNFLVTNDEDDDVDLNSSWSFGSNNPKSSLGASSNVNPGGSRSRDPTATASSRARSSTPGPANSYDDDEYPNQSMRRTSSGMLMPYDEDEDEMMAVGLFGRVSETINTAKDIAHVIWNVGWRK